MTDDGIGPKRRCRRCGLRFDQHVIDGKCADGRDFQASIKNERLASNSFNPNEVAVLASLIKNAAVGYDSKVIARSPAYASLARKVQTMQKRLAHLAKGGAAT